MYFLPLPCPIPMRGALLLGGFLLGSGNFHAQAATYTVTNTNDSGIGSLRQAITYANGAPDTDEIVFSAAVFRSSKQTITLTSQLPFITGPLYIAGPLGSSARLTINRTDVSGTYGTFVGANSGPLTVSDLTLTGRLGGIQNAGSGHLTVQGCTFSGTDYGILAGAVEVPA